MNIRYSKANVLIEAVRDILIGDTAGTGEEVKQISHYVGQRIYRSGAPFTNSTFPMITILVDEGESGHLLPTGTFMVNIRVWVLETDSAPNDKVSNLCSRIIALLHNQQDALNESVQGKNLRCRMIVKESSVNSPDPILQTVGRNIVFTAICDDETVNS